MEGRIRKTSRGGVRKGRVSEDSPAGKAGTAGNRFAERMARANEDARRDELRSMTVEKGIRALEDILRSDHLGLSLPPAPQPAGPIALGKPAKHA
jgi:hypothetical protein